MSQNWLRLRAHLARHQLELEIDPAPRQFANGLANLNYLLIVNGKEAVLRRPPAGDLPPGAYDMAREFRILRALSPSFSLAPHAIHLCEDIGVLGAPFQIIEYRRGLCLRGDTLPSELESIPDIGDQLSRTLIETLSLIHRVIPEAVGLGELGRPEGFLQRTVEGWAKRAGLAANPLPPVVSTVTAWLRRQSAPQGTTVLLHNDLKLDNLLLDPATLKPVAALDWDQCTRGDALFDLATTLSYWTEAGDPEAMQSLHQMPTARPGFWSRKQAAEAYAATMGADLSEFRFYRVLALFKLAVIFYQLHARYRDGSTCDAHYAGFGDVAKGVMDFAEAVSRGAAF